MPVVALASAGMAQEVNVEFESDANFSAFETYAWIDINGRGQQLDEFTANQLRSAVDAELAMKGLHKVDLAVADLLVGYQTALRNDRPITVDDTGWRNSPGWRVEGVATAQSSTILAGSVVLDMYIRSQKIPVWRGNVTKTLDVNAKPEKRDKSIQKGVQKLLRHYPPK